MQIHGYPYSDEGSHLHRGNARGRLAQRRLRRDRARRSSAPGVSDEAAVDEDPRDLRRGAGGPRGPGQQLQVDQLHHGPQRSTGGTATSCCSATPPTPRTSPSAPAPSWPWRTPSPWPPACTSTPDLEAALAAYETERRPVVESTQRAAQASLEWFENIGQYKDQDPVQFCFNLLTRSRRITYENLKLRDPEFAGPGGRANSPAPRASRAVAPAMFQPYRIGGLELKNRIVVSPMDMYSAIDGVPGDFHLVHLGSKALGGAGLVMTEMVCVSETGRITPGCSGLYNEAQQESWREIVDFVHSQLDREDRRPARPLRPQGLHQAHVGGHRRAAAEAGNWEPCGPSAIPYGPGSHGPAGNQPRRDGPGPGRVRRRHRPRGRGRLRPAGAARRPRLPALLVPLAAGQPAHRRVRRILENRLRYPLEVFDAVRAAWPADKPLTVRISATDWVDGGNTEDDAVAIARAFVEHGADGDRRLLRPGGQGGEAGLRPQLPDPVRGPDPAGSGRTGRRRRSSPSARSPPTTTSTRSCWPAARTSAPSAARTCTIRSGPCTRRSSRTTAGRAPTGRSSSAPAAASRRRPHRRGPAPPGAGAGAGDRRTADAPALDAGQGAGVGLATARNRCPAPQRRGAGQRPGRD